MGPSHRTDPSRGIRLRPLLGIMQMRGSLAGKQNPPPQKKNILPITPHISETQHTQHTPAPPPPYQGEREREREREREGKRSSDNCCQRRRLSAETAFNGGGGGGGVWADPAPRPPPAPPAFPSNRRGPKRRTPSRPGGVSLGKREVEWA